MVLPDSRRVSRAPRYSGTEQGSLTLFAYGAFTLYRQPSQTVRLRDRFVTSRRCCPAPRPALQPLFYNVDRLDIEEVWAHPRSLAATGGVAFAFFSSGY